MKDLSVLISGLLKPYNDTGAAAKCGVSRETIRKLRTGESTKLSTLKSICQAIGTPTEEWVAIVIAWVRQELGDEAESVYIESKAPNNSSLRDGAQSIESQAIKLFHDLTDVERDEIIKTMQRPGVIECVKAINRVWERLSVKRQNHPMPSIELGSSPNAGPKTAEEFVDDVFENAKAKVLGKRGKQS